MTTQYYVFTSIKDFQQKPEKGQDLKSNGLRVKTYLIFKPPFMSEGDALTHTSKWLVDVAPLSDEVSINPMNIQNRTIVDRLFRIESIALHGFGL